MASFPAAGQGAAGGLAFMSRTLGVVAGVQITGAVFGARGFAAAFALTGAVCVVAAGIAALSSGRERYDGEAGPDRRPTREERS
jgi:predicted MFS family arabinose efflux permease